MLTREVDIDFSANWVSLQFYRNEQGRLRFGKIGDMSLFDVETGAQERYFVYKGQIIQFKERRFEVLDLSLNTSFRSMPGTTNHSITIGKLRA